MAEFYLDHNIARRVGFNLRAAGHGATTALEAGLERAKDDEHLLYAAQHQWLLVSHNASDFILLHGAWQRWAAAWGVSAAHSGILIVPVISTRLTIESISQLLDDAITRQIPLANELYRWRAARGWVRQP